MGRWVIPRAESIRLADSLAVLVENSLELTHARLNAELCRQSDLECTVIDVEEASLYSSVF